MLSSQNLDDLNQIFLIMQQYSATRINIMDALELYEKSCKRLKVKKILESVRHDVGNGMKLPDAFDKHPKFFPKYIVEMMRVNEGTGQAAGVYAGIVKSLEQEIDLRRNVGSQLTQLIYIGVLLMITIGLVVFVVLPCMGNMMMSLNMDVPIYTQILIGAGNAALTYWWAFVILAVGIVTGALFFKKYYPEQFALFIMHVPLYNKIVYYRLQYRFAMVFGLCKDAGLDTITALKYTQDASDNALMYELLEKALMDLRRFGDSLTVALQKANKHKIMDDSYFLILQAGEKSDMAALMNMRSRFYQKELIVKSQEFSNKLNNFIITPVYALLALIVVVVWGPMFNMMFQMSSGGMGM
jgi:type IV pilus assembly protein PilC